jgi:hypothetical protein
MNRVLFDAYVIDTLMRDLVGHDKRPSSFILYLHLYRLTFGMKRRTCRASYQELSEDTGLSRSATQAAVRSLLRRRLIGMHKETPTSVPEYSVHRPWKRLGRGA